MDALAQRLDLLEQEVRKLRKRVRDSELKDQLTLDNPLNAPSIAGDTVRALFGYQGPQFEQSDVGLGSTPYTYIDHQVTGGESLLTLAAIHSNLSTPSQPYGQIILDSAGEVRIRTSGPGTGQATTTVTFDENGIAINGSPVGAMKVQNGGYYLIPAGPTSGTTVTSSASADTYGSWTEMRAASGNALYIVGVMMRAHTNALYTQLDIGTGAAASETSVGETKLGNDGAADGFQTMYFPYPIAVAANTRIACRTADEDALARNATVTLIVVDQADVTTL